jgi:cell division septal protein FtsQ
MIKKHSFRKPHRIKKKKSIFKSQLFWFGVLILIIGSGIFYLIIFSPWFQITEIQIERNREISVQKIKKVIQPLIEHQIGFWNTRSVFLANFKEINNILLKEFSDIAQIELKRKLPETLIVIIEERNPVAVFYHQNKRFLIDKEGIAFREIGEEQKANLLKIESLIGQQALKKELVEQITEIERELKQKEIPITEAIIVSTERLNIKTLEGWEIYFNLKDDISKQIFNLEVVIRERISPERRKNLQYIDLRFDKIFIYPRGNE